MAHDRKPPLFEKFVAKIAKKWIAGETIADAIESAREANAKGMSVILNHLGEHSENLEDIELSVKEYLTMLNKMDRSRIRGSISLKLTQIGLDRDPRICRQNAARIVERAKALDRFIWLDMESSEYLEDTIQIYFELLQTYRKIGVAFQSYLKDGTLNLLRILEHGGRVRLVKGAYKESEKIVFTSRSAVDRNFRRQMRLLFERAEDFAIATHDDTIIRQAVQLNARFNRRIEFQMLKGVKDDVKDWLIKAGFALAEYIPYGRDVAPYSVRRIRERPSNLLLLFRSLL
jgi:proline dehydrogenase